MNYYLHVRPPLVLQIPLAVTHLKKSFEALAQQSSASCSARHLDFSPTRCMSTKTCNTHDAAAMATAFVSPTFVVRLTLFSVGYCNIVTFHQLAHGS